MIAVFLAALPVRLHDLERFPNWDTTVEQKWVCRKHARRLRFLRNLHGWSDGYWDAALQENEANLHYWLLLNDLRDNPFGVGPVWYLRKLEQLRRLIGQERYEQGWHPPLYPDRPCIPDLGDGDD